jgi:regulator of replication initiation timing
MVDLVRLRRVATDAVDVIVAVLDQCHADTVTEAADEIEALRAELVTVKAWRLEDIEDNRRLEDEVERLRSSLAMRDEVLHRPRRRSPTP